MNELALIGGTGLNRLQGLELFAEHALDTPYGPPSHPVYEGSYDGHTLFFLARHGVPHAIAPHRINYRANIWALRELGVSQVIAFNAVGGILDALSPGQIVIPDQLVDYTWGRAHSFFDGDELPLDHIDFTEPYDAGLRLRLIEAAAALQLPVSPTATYAATQGPRLETAAEIRRQANYPVRARRFEPESPCSPGRYTCPPRPQSPRCRYHWHGRTPSRRGGCARPASGTAAAQPPLP